MTHQNFVALNEFSRSPTYFYRKKFAQVKDLKIFHTQNVTLLKSHFYL